MSNDVSAAVNELSDLPRGSHVRVMVQGVESPAEPSAPLDPKAYGTNAQYREALIRQYRSQVGGAKAAIEEQAKEFGLTATPGDLLNVVTLEGPSNRIVDLLKKVAVAGVILDKPMSLGPLPRPRRVG